MITLWVVLAWLVALGSWFGVSQATVGVAGICFACFMAITARIDQAHRQHVELLALLAKLSSAAASVVPRTASPRPQEEPAITEANIADIAKRYGVSDKT